jgi:hypothetical protein
MHMSCRHGKDAARHGRQGTSGLDRHDRHPDRTDGRHPAAVCARQRAPAALRDVFMIEAGPGALRTGTLPG